MAKKIPCNIRLHGSFKEHLMTGFESKTAAKKWLSECWDRPYTIVQLKQKQ